MRKFVSTTTILFLCFFSSCLADWQSNGYLSREEIISVDNIIGPPPTTDSLAFSSDKAISEAVFSLDKNSEQYKIAVHDATHNKKTHFTDFSEIFGQKISKKETPAIYSLMNKSTDDIDNAKQSAKNNYKRIRPFVFFDRKACDPSEDPKSYSYPSGHSSRAWGYALILAELKPQKAEQLFELANRKSESRVICGAHWKSDVQAAKTVAMANFAILNGNQAFLKDLEKAREEVKS